MKKYAHISYNLYCNFTNYGSALHTYALQEVMNGIAPGQVESIVLDYCPDVLKDKDILNPIKNLWDADEESKRMIELSMPAIRMNNDKFKQFYRKYYKLSSQKYTSENFNDSLGLEGLYGYVCGSDTIWCIREFKGFDDGYFGNYPVMKKARTVSYAASFGDVVFYHEELETLRNRMQNFRAISVRESVNLDFIKESVDIERVPVQRVLDPTLLLKGEDYEKITEKRMIDEPYILLYVRRYNKEMEEYADRIAECLSCTVVEISLRATNAERHIMKYDAGVEEFLSLVKYAECVITNSFHGAIFAIQMHTPFKVFSREQADTKIDELLELLDLKRCKMITGFETSEAAIDFNKVEEILEAKRSDSLEYIKEALEINE